MRHNIVTNPKFETRLIRNIPMGPTSILKIRIYYPEMEMLLLPTEGSLQLQISCKIQVFPLQFLFSLAFFFNFPKFEMQ